MDYEVLELGNGTFSDTDTKTKSWGANVIFCKFTVNLGKTVLLMYYFNYVQKTLYLKVPELLKSKHLKSQMPKQ